jgi:hypothetical protein
MSNVESLLEFARFRSAAAWGGGSATDFYDSEVAEFAAEGSTDPHIARQLFELQLLPFAVRLSVAGRCSLTTGTDVVASEPAPDEAPPSDFEMLDELRTPQAQIRRQIEALRRGSPLLYRERLARRLDFLLRALEEEGEPWAEDSPESLRQMLLFLEGLPEFRCPTITVTPFATFRAQWQADRNQHFAADFVPDGQVRFVVFAPDPGDPGRVQRVSGVVRPANAMKAVETYEVHRWAADART